jgi:hypothetical protein
MPLLRGSRQLLEALGQSDRRGRVPVPRLRRSLTLIVLTGLVVLVPLAYASPPDSVWTEGVYDAADYDDVVAAATSLDSQEYVDPAPVLVALLKAIGLVPPLGVGVPPGDVLQTPPTRAPPLPEAWTRNPPAEHPVKTHPLLFPVFLIIVGPVSLLALAQVSPGKSPKLPNFPGVHQGHQAVAQAG